jgi:hypothetical protein
VLRRCWPPLNRIALLSTFEELLFSEAVGGTTRGHERKKACVWTLTRPWLACQLPTNL